MVAAAAAAAAATDRQQQVASNLVNLRASARGMGANKGGGAAALVAKGGVKGPAVPMQ